MPRRKCTNDPTGFITAADTRSLETAARGGTPKNRTSIGVINAPPPIPVSPTTTPTPHAARAIVQFQSIKASPLIPGGLREQTYLPLASTRSTEPEAAGS